MKLLSLFLKKVELTVDEAFKKLVQDFNLDGQADLRTWLCPGKVPFKLVRIARNDEEKIISLPPDFIKAVRSLLSKHYSKLDFNKPHIFELGKAMTLREIDEQQRNWETYCQLQWGDS